MLLKFVTLASSLLLRCQQGSTRARSIGIEEIVGVSAEKVERFSGHAVP
jgi:hypothetical protein